MHNDGVTVGIHQFLKRFPNGAGAKAIRAKTRETAASGLILCIDEHAAYSGMPPRPRRVVTRSAEQFVDGMAHTK